MPIKIAGKTAMIDAPTLYPMMTRTVLTRSTCSSPRDIMLARSIGRKKLSAPNQATKYRLHRFIGQSGRQFFSTSSRNPAITSPIFLWWLSLLDNHLPSCGAYTASGDAPAAAGRSWSMATLTLSRPKSSAARATRAIVIPRPARSPSLRRYDRVTLIVSRVSPSSIE